MQRLLADPGLAAWLGGADTPTARAWSLLRGVLLRIAIDRDGGVAREPILATDQGLRGVAAGNFFADGQSTNLLAAAVAAAVTGALVVYFRTLRQR